MKNIFIVIFLLSLISIGYYYQNFVEPAETQQTNLDTGMMKFIKPDGKFSEFKATIADTYATRQRGLMFVKEMPENKGMYFDFDSEEVRKMWMKNTFIPLDMVFIGSDNNVRFIIKNTTPLSEEILSSVVPAKYVVELNAGVTDKFEIKVGDKFQITKD